MERKTFAVRRARSTDELEALLEEGARLGYDFVGATEGSDGETTLYFEGMTYEGARAPDSVKPFPEKVRGGTHFKSCCEDGGCGPSYRHDS